MAETSTTTDVLSFLDEAGNLPSLPAVALEVIRLTQNRDVDLEAVADALGMDPAIAGRLMRLSNSALFGLSQEVGTINQAIMVLGLKAVKLAVVSFSLLPTLGDRKLSGSEQYKDFWRRAVTAGVAVKQLFGQQRRHLADEAFLAALLMDVGMPVMLRTIPERYAPVSMCLDAGHASPELERSSLGFTHADVSAYVLRKWNLPELLITAVAHHHDYESVPEEAGHEAREIARGLSFAHDVASVICSKVTGSTALAIARRKAEDWYGLGFTDMNVFLEQLTEHIVRTGDLWDVDFGTVDQLAATLMRHHEDMLALSIGATAELEKTQVQMKELETRARTDALTGVRNRAAFDKILAEHWSLRQGRATGKSIGLLMIDADRFKELNDTYGHHVGDEVLKAVAGVLDASCRGGDRSDVVCRYGGEEFALLVFGATPRELQGIAERMRSAVEVTRVRTASGELSVTVSIGGAILDQIPADMVPTDLIELADKNLYAAKKAGRNRCILGI